MKMVGMLRWSLNESIEDFLDSKFSQQNCEDLFNRSLAAVGCPAHRLCEGIQPTLTMTTNNANN